MINHTGNILGPDGQPINPQIPKTPKVEKVNPTTFGPAMQAIKQLIENVQKYDDEVGAYVYPDKNLVIFWKRDIILDKIDITQDELFHKDFVRRKTKQILRRWRAAQTLDTSLIASIRRQTQRLKLGKKL
jgi:hypothetical protein